MNTTNPKIYSRYPLPNILIYNGTTVFHFILGGTGIMLGYHSWTGNILGSLYILFAFFQMYVLMPLTVCSGCVYYRMDNSRCISGMNLVSKRTATEGNPKDFSNRGKGFLCHNNLYMAALVFPIIAMVPALILDFSLTVLAIWFLIIILLLFRFFVIFRKTACIHCAAKNKCPNARSMGLDK